MGHKFGSLEELGEGYGFRKIRRELGVTAFGVNAIVMPPGYLGFHHYHDAQDELYNTRFWVVRARVSASAIYGLGTVFSGAYIDLDPGKTGKPAHSFTGLEEPPIVTTGLPGRHFVLESERRGSLEIGAPIYYRQIRAGEVVAYQLSEDGTKIISKIFVNAPYHQFIRNNTRFWNASGVDLKLDASGITLETESLVSILVGGIAFDTFRQQRSARRASLGEFNLQTFSES